MHAKETRSLNDGSESQTSTRISIASRSED